MQISEFSEKHQTTHGASIQFSAATVNGDGTVSVTMTTEDGDVVGTGTNKKEARQDAVNAAVAQGWPKGGSAPRRRHKDPHRARLRGELDREPSSRELLSRALSGRGRW